MLYIQCEILCAGFAIINQGFNISRSSAHLLSYTLNINGQIFVEKLFNISKSRSHKNVQERIVSAGNYTGLCQPHYNIEFH